jgi:hypothetical protein
MVNKVLEGKAAKSIKEPTFSSLAGNIEED